MNMTPRPRIASSVREVIGCTPMVRLNRLPKPGGASVVAKLESVNPGGSVKDRIAVAMLDAAEQQGRLKPGSTIVEDRKSTRLNSSHSQISYAVFCLKKKKIWR